MSVAIFNMRLENKKGSLVELPRKFKPLLAEALRFTVMFWHRVILPRHWFPSARSEYRHAPRSSWYLKFKRRTGKGSGRFVDNLYTGKTRRFMLHGPRFTSTSKQATCYMDAPVYVTHPSSRNMETDIDILRELLDVSIGDHRMLGIILQKDLTERVKALEKK